MKKKSMNEKGPETLEEIIESVECCIHIDEEGHLSEKCDECPMDFGEWKEAGCAACAAFSDLRVEMPYELVEKMLKKLKEHKEVVHCEDCMFAKDIGYRDEETDEELLGCTKMVGGIDSDYVMTVRRKSYCSWGELNY